LWRRLKKGGAEKELDKILAFPVEYLPKRSVRGALFFPFYSSILILFMIYTLHLSCGREKGG
jgi:hypothetical protein